MQGRRSHPCDERTLPPSQSRQVDSPGLKHSILSSRSSPKGDARGNKVGHGTFGRPDCFCMKALALRMQRRTPVQQIACVVIRERYECGVELGDGSTPNAVSTACTAFSHTHAALQNQGHQPTLCS